MKSPDLFHLARWAEKTGRRYLLSASCITVLFFAIRVTADAQKRAEDSDAPSSVSPRIQPRTSLSPAPHVMRQSDLADAIMADTLERLRAQADRHFHNGEYSHLINLNRILVQGDPHDVDTYATTAWLLWSTDRNDQAIALLKQGLAANPKTYYMYDELGQHYLLHLKDAKTAMPYYEQAVKYPCPYNTWHGLAHCYEMTDQWEKAVQAWTAAAKYQDNVIGRAHLERARKHLSEQKAK